MTWITNPSAAKPKRIGKIAIMKVNNAPTRDVSIVTPDATTAFMNVKSIFVRVMNYFHIMARFSVIGQSSNQKQNRLQQASESIPFFYVRIPPRIKRKRGARSFPSIQKNPQTPNRPREKFKKKAKTVVRKVAS
jgi:hypothetical protein